MSASPPGSLSPGEMERESETDPINQTDCELLGAETPPTPQDCLEPEPEPEQEQERQLEEPEPEEPEPLVADEEAEGEEPEDSEDVILESEENSQPELEPESESPEAEAPEVLESPEVAAEETPEVTQEAPESPEPTPQVSPEAIEAEVPPPSSPESALVSPQDPLTNAPEAMEDVPTVELESLSVHQPAVMQNNENTAEQAKSPVGDHGQNSSRTPVRSGIRKPQAVLRQPAAVVRPSTTPVAPSPPVSARPAPSPRSTSRMSRERSDVVQKSTSTRSIDNVGKFTPKVNAKFVNVKSKVGSTSNHRPGGGNVEIFSEKKQYNVQSRVGSLQNASHVAGGGNVQIESRRLDFSHASPKVGSKTGYVPAESNVKIVSEKLTWNAKSKVGSMENAAHKATGGNVQIQTQKLNWRAESKVGSKDNIKHRPGGGNIKIFDEKIHYVSTNSSRNPSRNHSTLDISSC